MVWELVTAPEWPSSVCRAAPVTASQSLTVLSHEPEATVLPSGEKATELTSSEWPSSVVLARLQVSSLCMARFIRGSL